MNTRHIPSKARRPDRNCSQHRACQRIAMSFSIFVLLLFAGCGGNSTASAPTVSATPTDYSQAQNWETLPNASQGVDVLFFYPTTYNAPAGSLSSNWTSAWNQPLTNAYVDAKIKSQVASKTGVFAKAGTNLYVPYFQQASGDDVLDALLYSTTPRMPPRPLRLCRWPIQMLPTPLTITWPTSTRTRVGIRGRSF